MEYYCDGNEVLSESHVCENNCEDGACKMISGKCTDSDGGANYFVKGTTSAVKFSTSAGVQRWTDTCVKDYERYHYSC